MVSDFERHAQIDFIGMKDNRFYEYEKKSTSMRLNGNNDGSADTFDFDELVKFDNIVMLVRRAIHKMFSLFFTYATFSKKDFFTF